MSSQSNSKKSIFWDRDLILQTQRDTKKEIDQASIAKPADFRLQYILKGFSAIEDDITDPAKLRRYILGMSALVHHERNSGLTKKQIEHISETIRVLLLTSGIKPGQSRSASLYRDLHIVLSQIERREGKHWTAAWQQFLAIQCARSNEVDDEGFHAMTSANRALRLGNICEAVKLYYQTEVHTLSENQRLRCRFELTRALRLCCDFPQAEKVAAETLQTMNINEAMKLEFQWEELCRKAVTEKDLMPMVQAVKKGHTFYNAEYFVEAYMWMLASEKKTNLEIFPRISTMERRVDLEFNRRNHLLKFCQLFDDCYDTDIPLHFRLEKLGFGLEDLNKLITIDKEQLVLAAAARFLSRSKCYNLASIALERYRQLSLQMTMQKHEDSFGLISDLLTRDWFTKTITHAPLIAPQSLRNAS